MASLRALWSQSGIQLSQSASPDIREFGIWRASNDGKHQVCIIIYIYSTTCLSHSRTAGQPGIFETMQKREQKCSAPSQMETCAGQDPRAITRTVVQTQRIAVIESKSLGANSHILSLCLQQAKPNILYQPLAAF